MNRAYYKELLLCVPHLIWCHALPILAPFSYQTQQNQLLEKRYQSRLAPIVHHFAEFYGVICQYSNCLMISKQ